MRRVLVFTLLASAFAFFSLATPALAQGGIPQGSYQQTCNNVSVNGAVLVANCQDRNGNWRSAQLPDFQTCNGDIMNDNGNLRCASSAGYNYGPGGPGPQGVNGPNGSYVQTCNNVRVKGDDLHATCQTRDGSWHDTKLDDFNKCRGDIMNDNGNLRCVAGGAPYGGYGGGPGYGNAGYGGPGYPGGPAPVSGPFYGSYVQTCRDMRVSGDDLHASCQTRDGNWRNTKLDDYNNCRGDIMNDNGKLRCVAGAYNYGYSGGPYPQRYVNGPGGSYVQSCQDVNVKGDDLHARCQTRGGDIRDAKLDDFRKCKSDIINDDGRLRCQK